MANQLLGQKTILIWLVGGREGGREGGRGMVAPSETANETTEIDYFTPWRGRKLTPLTATVRLSSGFGGERRAGQPDLNYKLTLIWNN